MFSKMHGDALFTHSGIPYLHFFQLVNACLAPRSYFEIGTNSGGSLKQFGCDAVCVDPEFVIEQAVWNKRKRTLLFQMTSDDFFADYDLRAYFPAGPDVVFLDGMHRAEFLLRDFIKTERLAHDRTLLFMHDCLPLNRRMAERMAQMGPESEGDLRHFWTGDVWRVLFALKSFRPELKVRYLDCPPTGLIVIDNLNPASVVLSQHYDQVMAEIMAIQLDDDRIRELWNLFPTVDTARLAASPADITAVLNCR